MSHYSVIFPGIFFRLLGVKQGLWYAHAHKSFSLFLATRIANMPKGEGYKKPGSMNPRKTGFMSIKANEAKRILSK